MEYQAKATYQLESKLIVFIIRISIFFNKQNGLPSTLVYKDHINIPIIDWPTDT